jgi:hypothetical protein
LDVNRLKWIDISNEKLHVYGLPWYSNKDPNFRRIPIGSRELIRKPVWELATCPSGGRLRFLTNTSELRINLNFSSLFPYAVGSSILDVYVDGSYWNSLRTENFCELEWKAFQDASQVQKDITIYLPLFAQIHIIKIGIDDTSEINHPKEYSNKKPVVFYGSSIAQGQGSSRPGMSYEAIIMRQLNLDYVDFAFSGNGRAESEVVKIITDIEASCYIIDVGKSFGWQSIDIFTRMLRYIHNVKPEVPIICITPIYSTLEFYNKEYKKLSEYIRNLIRNSVFHHIKNGNKDTYLVEGLDLLGRDEADALYDEIHPNDLGYKIIADKLLPIIKKILVRYTTTNYLK